MLYTSTMDPMGYKIPKTMTSSSKGSFKGREIPTATTGSTTMDSCGLWFPGPWLSDALSRSTLGVWFGCWDATPRSNLGSGGFTVHLSFDSPLYAPWCWMVLKYLPTFALKTTQM